MNEIKAIIIVFVAFNMDQVSQETCTSEYYTKTAAHFSTRPPHCKSSVCECVCAHSADAHFDGIFANFGSIGALWFSKIILLFLAELQ